MEFRRRLRVLLKLRAKSMFLTNFGVCMAVTLITSAITMLGGYAAGLVLPSADSLLNAPDLSVYYPKILLFYGIALGTILLSSPLTMGAYAWFSELSMQRYQKIREVFSWLGDPRLTLKAFGATLWFLGISLVWAAAFLGIPVLTILFITARVKEMAVGAVVFLSGLLTLLVLTGAILTAVRVCAYLPAFFVLAAHPNMHIREVFRECSLFMQGRRWEFFELLLSFLGWFLLSSFTCGLVALYVRPYMNLTLLSFTQQARGSWLMENGKAFADAVWTPETANPEEEDEDV